MFNLEYIRYAESFCALQVPIYYYVKTKGSLANSNLTIARTVKMKLTVFEYYHQFFKTVLDEEEYERSRLKVYRFLLDAANDGSVPLPVLPNSKKLGDERVHINAEIIQGSGIFYDALREQKLLERCLETAALKNSLSLSDVKLLLALQELEIAPTYRELADFADLSRSTLSLSLQKLLNRNLIQVTDSRESSRQAKRISISFTDEAAPLLADLDIARQTYRSARLATLAPEEQEHYRLLTEKIQNHLRDTLS